MPKLDRTFSHRDIIRIFCNHLTSAEQRRVLAEFEYGEPCEDKLKDPCELVPIFEFLDVIEDLVYRFIGLVDLAHDILLSLPRTILQYLGAILSIVENIPLIGDTLKNLIDKIIINLIDDIFMPLEKCLKESAIEDAIFILDQIDAIRDFFRAVCEKWQA